MRLGTCWPGSEASDGQDTTLQTHTHTQALIIRDFRQPAAPSVKTNNPVTITLLASLPPAGTNG